MNRARPLLVSGDPDLIDDVLRLAAANGVEVHLATDAEAARSRWVLAPLVLVGADAAACAGGRAAAAATRRRAGQPQSPTPDDWQRAVSLGAEHVVRLPDAERWLIDRLADSGEGSPRDGAVVAVVGAGGGAGASTFAAGLALAAAARSLRVLLVDARPRRRRTRRPARHRGRRRRPVGATWPTPVAGSAPRPSTRRCRTSAGVAVLSVGREGPTALARRVAGGRARRGGAGLRPRRRRPPASARPGGRDRAGARGRGPARVRQPGAVDGCGRAPAGRAPVAVRARSASSCASIARGVSEDAVRAALSAPDPGAASRTRRRSPSRADDGEPPSLRDALRARLPGGAAHHGDDPRSRRVSATAPRPGPLEARRARGRCDAGAGGRGAAGRGPRARR